MGIKSFSYRDALGFGWDVMKNNFWFFVGVGIILLLISLPSQVLGNVMENYPGKIPPPLAYLLLPVTFIVEIIVGIGLIKITLSFCDGQRPKFTTLFNAWGCFWKYIGAGILYSLIIGSTFVACVLPLVLLSGAIGNPCFAFVFFTVAFILATILAIKFSFCYYFVIDKGLGPINALRASSRTTMEVKWSLFVFGILCSLINLLGVLCLGVGLFATFPTVMVAMVLVYRELSAMTPGLAKLGIDGPDVQPASGIPPGVPIQPSSVIQSDIPLGLAPSWVTNAVQPSPATESGPHIQPNTERGKNNFLLLAVILGIIVIVAGIAYLFWPTIKGTVGSCKTVFSNEQLKLTRICSDDPSAIVISAIKINADPEQDPLACALVVAKKIKLEGPDKNRLLERIAVAYAQTGGYEQALQISNTLEKAFGKAGILTEIASNCVKAGEKGRACDFLSQALQVAKMIKNDFIKDDHLELIAIKYAEVGQYDQALQIANTIKRACHKADALAGIASNYAEAGQADKASGILFQALQAAKSEDSLAIKNEKLAEIVVKYAEIGQYDIALEVTNSIGSNLLRAEALSGISANMKPDQKEKATDILAQSLQETKRIGDADFEAMVLAHIAAKYAETGQYDQALQIANTIKRANRKADALTEIAANYAKAGQKDKASDILFQASEAAVNADSDFTVLLLGATIASNYVKIGQKDTASFILSKVLPLTETIRSDSLKDAMLANITTTYAQTGQYDQALQVAQTITPRSYRAKVSKANALVSILIEYAKTGHLRSGREL